MVKPFKLLDVTGFEPLVLAVDGIDKRCPGKRLGRECSPPLSQTILPMLDPREANAPDFAKTQTAESVADGKVL